MVFDYAFFDEQLLFLVTGIALVALTLVGLAALLCAWGGARAGMVLTGLVILLTIGCLVVVLRNAYWQWWICVPAIYAGWLGFGAWRARAATMRRLPFRFSLAGMFLFVLVVALITGGVVMEREQGRIEHELVAQLERHSGSHIYEIRFGRPTSVIISPKDDAELREIVAILRQLSALSSLQVNGATNLSAEALADLAELTTLRSLLLQHLYVTDGELAPLAKLQRLELLELEASGLTDAGLPQLYPLKRLRKLWLYNTDPMKISAQGMQRLHDELPKWDN